MTLSVSQTLVRTSGVEDRVNAYGWKALAGSVIGYAMDGFDMLILCFMLAAISADRIGRKPAFIMFRSGAVTMVYLYAQVTDPHTLLWMGAIMGMFVNGTLGGVGALMSEAYPTAARATAQNVLFNLGRAVGGLGPLTVGAVATAYSFHTAIALLALIYVLDIFATVFLIPELIGKELE